MTSAEPRRRHQRIETPLDVVIDGPVIRAVDWSLSGFALPTDALPDMAVGEVFEMEACFHMGFAVIGTQFQAAMVRREEDRIGCRFVNPSDDQLGLLRQLHSAHRGGQTPRPGAVAASIAAAAVDPSRSLVARSHDTPNAAEHPPAKGWSAWLSGGTRAALAFSLIGLLGLGMGAYAIMGMMRPVEAAFAAVNQPGQVLRAPSDGVIEAVLAHPGDLLSPNSALVRFRPRGGEVNTEARFLPSPCTCSVSGVQVQEGQAVYGGDPLIRLAPGNGTGTRGQMIIESLVPWEHADQFSAGAAVKVRVSGIDGIRSGRVILDPQMPASALPPVLADAAQGRLATVYVTVNSPGTPLQNGQPARVRLDRSLLGALFGG